MSFLTSRKRARALGASGGGTEHHWYTVVTSSALLVLIPLFVVTFGTVLGRSYEEVLVALANPFRALVIGLTLVVGLVHFRNGVQVVLEDYAHGAPRKAMVVAAVCVTYALLAAGLFAVARLAL